MLIREVEEKDLDALQALYLHLHEKEKLPESVELKKLWSSILEDESYHIMVGIMDGIIVSSVTLVIIKNLTRCMRSYAIIENVITHVDYRGRGHAKSLMNQAVDVAKQANCYKIMLLTGSKKESTLKFYEDCGFHSNDKTAFIIRF